MNLLKNTNRTIEEQLDSIPNWVEAYQEAGIPIDQFAVMATFGC